MKRLVLILFFLLCLAPAKAQAWQAFVDEVLDGATFIVREQGSGKRVLVRLFGVVVPKRGERAGVSQPFAEEAFAKARSLLPKDLPVTVHDMRQDTMGKDRGFTVTLPGGSLMQQELLQAGLAWVAPLHCGNCLQWKKLEKLARKERIGLWSDDAPVPPWEWPDQQ